MMKTALAAVAALAALVLAACGAPAVDPNDPWKTLHPWNHARADVQKLPSGVEYVVIRKGDGKGASPGPFDRVRVKYEGRLAEMGLVFDSTYPTGETVVFAVDGVIPGWTEGLQKMQPGDMFMFWIPAKAAYGERGQGMEVPPNADLMFQVELVEVTPDPWGKVTPWPTASSEVIRRPSGLEYLVVKSGPTDAATPTDNDDVEVAFEGRLETVEAEEGDAPADRRRRSKVVSTYEQGDPMVFPVSELAAGWNEVVKQMRPGDHWMVRMPPQLLYGSTGDGRVPPDATVIYEIELLGIQPHSSPLTPQPPQ